MKVILGWVFIFVALVGFYGLAYYMPYTVRTRPVFIGGWVGAAGVLVLCYALVRANWIQTKYGVTFGYWAIALSVLGYYSFGMVGAIMHLLLGNLPRAILAIGIHILPLVASIGYTLAVNRHAVGHKGNM